jgi:hypothetical protein
LQEIQIEGFWMASYVGKFCFARDRDGKIITNQDGLVMFFALDGAHRCRIMKVFIFSSTV